MLLEKLVGNVCDLKIELKQNLKKNSRNELPLEDVLKLKAIFPMKSQKLFNKFDEFLKNEDMKLRTVSLTFRLNIFYRFKESKFFVSNLRSYKNVFLFIYIPIINFIRKHEAI